jgi:hypothetical protein
MIVTFGRLSSPIHERQFLKENLEKQATRESFSLRQKNVVGNPVEVGDDIGVPPSMRKRLAPLPGRLC